MKVSTGLLKPYFSAMQFHCMYPTRSLLNNYATLAGGSDWPVSTPNPWNAIAQATSCAGPKGVLNSLESIEETMFYASTHNAARANGFEKDIGSLIPDKQPDLIVLGRDVFSVPEQR